ncbi:type II toxin-antitoxin system RelE/ParE family toxin [Methylobacterium sp. J-026]|uniref:type II toxin-antitoxin system RelE/ParE family toxin n=1 Tax=Methylobacterium sp. J-026 TaxID=2836624 RepID=UPI001FB9340E|nr:type II toxin-antitoxin system RelE/ParE family toxin [Methylobacterium sp. J-026]MCJ2137188.1 type II toxin-antitoxin system RelE/ParE family toxin [Methylobacterium sp. J-026]
MPEVLTTEVFDRWIDSLRDAAGRARILRRIVRLQEGHRGQVAPVGGGVSEMKIDTGPGCRVYFVERGDGGIVIRLCGGDKDSQTRDIARARDLARTVWVGNA